MTEPTFLRSVAATYQFGQDPLGRLARLQVTARSRRIVPDLFFGSGTRLAKQMFQFSSGKKMAMRQFIVCILLFSQVAGQSLAPSNSSAQSLIPVTDPSYALINNRVSQVQSQFFVYADIDSPFNHGFPSGIFGSSTTAMGKLHLDASCVYSATALGGCSTDPAAMDRARGTVLQLAFDPLVSGEFVGINFEEPENWGTNHNGIGYDLTGATQLVFDAVSPTGGIQVQFSVNGEVSSFRNIPQQWSTITIDLKSLGLTTLTH